MYESIGDYEYTKKDLIGHGAFAIVYKGRYREVVLFLINYLITFYLFLLLFSFNFVLNNFFPLETRHSHCHKKYCQEEFVKIEEFTSERDQDFEGETNKTIKK